MNITIDGTSYDLPIKVINRKADMLYKYAERTEDGVLHSELIGVYYNFEVQMGQSVNNTADYVSLWDKVTEPVTSHTITMPDTSGTLTFSCYFANIADEVKKWQDSGVNYFRSLKFSIIGISPARTP